MGAAATIHAPIFFIDYSYFSSQEGIPAFDRCYQQLQTPETIDQQTSALVFVSYTWLRKVASDPGA